jgi:hypothetical protein
VIIHERERPIDGVAIASWASLAADPSRGIAARHDAGHHRVAGPAGPATPLLRFLPLGFTGDHEVIKRMRPIASDGMTNRR